MAEHPGTPEPIDEEEPIPGTPRSRLSLAAGLLFVLLIVGFFIWFFLNHSERSQGGGFFG